MKYEEVKEAVIQYLIDQSKYKVEDLEAIDVDCNDFKEIDHPKTAIPVILKQLQKKEIIQIIPQEPEYLYTNFEYNQPVYGDNPEKKGLYLIHIIDLEKLKAESDQTAKQNPNFETKDENFFIIYSNNREVLLNGKILLSNPNFDSENDVVFHFLYKNPNRTFSKKEIESGCGLKVTKPFHKIIENLGFSKGLKDAFFDVSKTSIKFKNPAEI